MLWWPCLSSGANNMNKLICTTCLWWGCLHTQNVAFWFLIRSLTDCSYTFLCKTLNSYSSPTMAREVVVWTNWKLNGDPYLLFEIWQIVPLRFLIGNFSTYSQVKLLSFKLMIWTKLNLFYQFMGSFRGMFGFFPRCFLRFFKYLIHVLFPNWNGTCPFIWTNLNHLLLKHSLYQVWLKLIQ